MSSFNLVEEWKIIDSACNRAIKIGYRIKPCPFVDYRFRICDPMGAVMMFSDPWLPASFMRGFARGYDNMSPLMMSLEELNGYVLGRTYRSMYG